MLQPDGVENTFSSCFPLVAGAAGGNDLSSLLFPTSEDLLQRSFVPRRYLLSGEAENLCVSESRPRPGRRQHLLWRFNYAGQNVLQQRICEGNLGVYQSE